ncbi:MAG: hypothetical protein HC888_16280, partial [Candidatus Competibacteraceae bacterium]|nr:hypothetical protein [Candidatus Competibacteraceae bacterium]
LGRYQKKFVEEYGVNIVGGCCGTTPAHIKCIADSVRGLKPKPRKLDPGLYLSGPQEAVLLDSREGLIRIGERLNVRGSIKVREAWRTRQASITMRSKKSCASRWRAWAAP